MPARNLDHDAVVEALIADGWTITHDPYRIHYNDRDIFIDLAMEKTSIAAEKGTQRISVEVQSFAGPSDIKNMQEAMGQYLMYRYVLVRLDPAR